MQTIAKWALGAALLALLLATAPSLVTWAQKNLSRQAPPDPEAQAGFAREARQAATMPTAPAPLPGGLPLMGPPGRDAEGYTRQTADRDGGSLASRQSPAASLDHGLS